jgi:transcriptional regulator with XRE-family HTH domain
MEKQKDLRSIIASRMTTARKHSGLSQAQVASELNIPRPSISEIEAARRRVSAEELVLFADLYQVDINWLAGRGTEEADSMRDSLELAARDVANLKPDDLEKVISLLTSLKPKEKE